MPVEISMAWAPAAILDFAKRAEAHLISHGPDSLQELREDFANLFGDRLMLTSLVKEYLRRVASGDTFFGDGSVGADAFIAWYSPNMALRILKDRQDVISFSANIATDVYTNYPFNSLILFVSHEEVRVDWYRLEEGASFDQFDCSLKIKHDGMEMCAPGSCIYVEGRRRFPIFEPRPGDFYINLTSAAVCSQFVSFDPGTLQPLGASMASEISSILCVMLDLVWRCSETGPVDAIKRLIKHSDHHVRWNAVTAFGKFEKNEAVAIIKELATDDRHKFIRDAAKKTLESLGESA